MGVLRKFFLSDSVLKGLEVWGAPGIGHVGVVPGTVREGVVALLLPIAPIRVIVLAVPGAATCRKLVAAFGLELTDGLIAHVAVYVHVALLALHLVRTSGAREALFSLILGQSWQGKSQAECQDQNCFDCFHDGFSLLLGQ